jgi:comEA protein
MIEHHLKHPSKSPVSPKQQRHGARSRAARLAAIALLCLCAAAAPALAAPASGASLTGVVNVNTASPEELQVLPGIGESRAQAIVAEREQRGGFKSVEELVDVKGIGEGMLVRLRPYVSLSGKSTAQPLE